MYINLANFDWSLSLIFQVFRWKEATFQIVHDVDNLCLETAISQEAVNRAEVHLSLQYCQASKLSQTFMWKSDKIPTIPESVMQ